MTTPVAPEPMVRARPRFDYRQIPLRADLVRLVGAGGGAKAAASERGGLLAHCPHCQGKQTVVVRTQRYFCHACEATGDAVDWLRATTPDLSYSAALVRLAELERQPDIAEAIAARADAAHMALAAYGQWTREQFAQSAEAQAYWASRGLSLDLAVALDVGYAPPSLRGFFEHYGKNAPGQEAMVDAGLMRLVPVPGQGQRARGIFNGRLLFPIKDDKRPIAFGGRWIGEARDGPTPPKYLNSANTITWTKADTLWGFHEAKAAIAKERTAIIVEGYFARARLLSLGMQHVVATCGTSLTRGQADLLVGALGTHANQKKTVVVLYDDGARTQSFRAARLLLAAGADVRVPKLPRGSDDPDTWVRESGPEPLRALLQDPPGLAAARIADVEELHGADLPLLERVELVEALFDDLHITTSGSVQKLALAILTTRFGIAEDEVKACVKLMRGNLRRDPKKAR